MLKAASQQARRAEGLVDEVCKIDVSDEQVPLVRRVGKATQGLGGGDQINRTFIVELFPPFCRQRQARQTNTTKLQAKGFKTRRNAKNIHSGIGRTGKDTYAPQPPQQSKASTGMFCKNDPGHIMQHWNRRPDKNYDVCVYTLISIVLYLRFPVHMYLLVHGNGHQRCTGRLPSRSSSH